MSSRTMVILAAVGWACFGVSGCGGRVNSLNEAALTQLQKGNLPQAATLLEEAARVAPNRYELHLNRAEVYRRLGRWGMALEAVETAARLAPRQADVVTARARLQLLAGRASDALTALEAVHEPLRSRPEIQFYHGLALMENGRLTEAQPLLETFVQRHPTSAAGHAALGRLHLRLGAFTEGKHQLELALRQDPNLIEAHLYLAQHFLADVQDYRRAKEQLYTARGRAPADPRVHLLLGETNLALQLLNEADRAFERTIQLNPDAWRAYLGMAEAALRRGQVEQSLSFAKRAEEKGSDHPEVYNFLARVYSQRHQTTLAIEAYRESLKRNPNQPEVREALAKLEQS